MFFSIFGINNIVQHIVKIQTGSMSPFGCWNKQVVCVKRGSRHGEDAGLVEFYLDGGLAKFFVDLHVHVQGQVLLDLRHHFTDQRAHPLFGEMIFTGHFTDKTFHFVLLVGTESCVPIAFILAALCQNAVRGVSEFRQKLERP